jgi:Ulp1 family protease
VKFILDLPEIPSGFTDMAKYLQGPLMDDEFRRKLRAEQEIDIVFDRQLNKYLLQLGLLARDMQVKEQQHQEAVQQQLEAVKQQQEAEQQLREAEQQLQEAEQQLREAEQQLRETEQQKQEAGQERLEAEETAQSERLQKLNEQNQKLEMARKFARYLMQTGASIDFICNETGLNPDEIAAANS